MRVLLLLTRLLISQVQSPTSADFLRVTESDFLTDVLL